MAEATGTLERDGAEQLVRALDQVAEAAKTQAEAIRENGSRALEA